MIGCEFVTRYNFLMRSMPETWWNLRVRDSVSDSADAAVDIIEEGEESMTMSEGQLVHFHPMPSSV